MSPVTRRRLRVVQLLFAGAAGALVARAASAWVEGALRPPPGQARPDPRPPPPPTRLAALDGVALARLTGLAAEPSAGEGGPEDPPPPGPVRSALPLRLLGTLVNEERPEWSVASLQDRATGRATTCLLHDLVLGAEVLAIERARVVVRRQSRLEFLDGQGADPVALTRGLPGGPGPVPGARIRQVGPDAYEVPRAELEGLVDRLDEVAAQGRLMPVTRDGRVAGFRVSGFRPDSLYARLGLQDGDVIQRVNGRDLGSADRLLELPALLGQAGQIELELGRRGGTVRTHYTIR